MNPQISAITLAVRDIERAKEFYSQGWALRSSRKRVGSSASSSAGLVHAGALRLGGACRAFWGGYSGYFADPDGY
jgi:catechol 2,3-dioxygenase-like lactoylglutathione lyase family enzyme